MHNHPTLGKKTIVGLTCSTMRNVITEYKTLSIIKIEFDFKKVLFGFWFFFGDFFECYGGFCRYRFLCYRVFFVLFVCHEQLLDCINAL